MTGWAQRFVVNQVTSGWCPAISGVLWGSMLGSVLYHIFINDLDAGIECTVSNFSDDVKLGGVRNSLVGREALKRDIDRLESWQ